ncbi:MAG: DMT family transporter [Salibacteraceae bacterium]
MGLNEPSVSNKLKAHVALAIVGSLYGLNYIVAKGIMPDYIGPSGFILYRVVGATILFWIAHRMFSREKLAKEDVPRVVQCAVFGVAMNQLFFFNGLNLTSPIHASVIMTVNPILVLLAASVVLREQITGRKIGGIALGISGALALILLPLWFDSSEKGNWAGNPLGDAMILINAISYALYLVSVKPLMQKYQAITVIKWVFTYGCVLVLPFGYSQAMQVDWHAMPAEILAGVLFVIVGVTFLVYFLNVYAMKTVSPTVVSVYIYFQPLLAGFLSIFLGMEHINWIKILGAALIFAGVYLVSTTRVRSLAPPA